MSIIKTRAALQLSPPLLLLGTQWVDAPYTECDSMGLSWVIHLSVHGMWGSSWHSMTRLWRCTQIFNIHQWKALSSTRLVDLGASHWKSDNQRHIWFRGSWLFCGIALVFFLVSVLPSFLSFCLSFFPIYIIPCSYRKGKIEADAILQGKAALLPSGFKCSFPENDENNIRILSHGFTWCLSFQHSEYHWSQVSPTHL